MYIGMESWTNSIHTGDCVEVLQEMPQASVHACVTDPPYAEGDYSGFMGKSWDSFDGPKEFQEWCESWAQEVKRVLKPGGHLLAFGSDDGHHRTACGIEDAGFEIRTHINWIYGSGFPKAQDMSKAIDKRKGEFSNRSQGQKYHNPDGTTRDYDGYDDSRDVYAPDDDGNEARRQSLPATPEAKKWDGWKTGLKPATEFVVMARKPFDGATVDCVQEHGTGALNIDATRIETEEGADLSGGGPESWKHGHDGRTRPFMEDEEAVERHKKEAKKKQEHAEENGRYPSNVVFDELEAQRLDQQVGEVGANPVGDSGAREGSHFGNTDHVPFDYADGKHGPSRYFYTSKASKAERTENGSIDNTHPTVKPQDLMEWLVKMLTRETQIVIDPFTGSGTTCKAAKHLNRQFIGIEKQEKWADVARVRCNLTPENPSVVRADDAQQGFEAYADGGDD